MLSIYLSSLQSYSAETLVRLLEWYCHLSHVHLRVEVNLHYIGTYYKASLSAGVWRVLGGLWAGCLSLQIELGQEKSLISDTVSDQISWRYNISKEKLRSAIKFPSNYRYERRDNISGRSNFLWHRIIIRPHAASPCACTRVASATSVRNTRSIK